MLPRKMMTSRPLKMHFHHPRTKIRVSERNTDIIKFWLFYSVTAHEYVVVQFFSKIFSKEKKAVCLPEITGEF